MSAFFCQILIFLLFCFFKQGKEEKLEKPATWSVLRDNYLTGSNLKDWDKCGEIKLEDNIDEVELN